MSEGLTAALIMAAFVIIFPLFWMAIILIVARVGGWHGLAEIYAAQKPASGEQFNFVSARFGRFTNYGNCLAISVSSTGLHLQPFILFRTGHAALFIPWEQVLELKPWDVWLFSSAHLTINRPKGRPPVSITFYGKKLIEALQKHAPHHLVDG